MPSSRECDLSRGSWDYLRRVHITPRPAGTCVVEFVIQSKKTRARLPKVRSGCISCKIRRVKCDEGKPTCQRCKKASLKCDGYGSQPLHTSANPTQIATAGKPLGQPLLPRRNPWPATLNQQDVIYFDLFRTQLVYGLSGYACSDFWSRIVLCESMTDECVLESILAIGALSKAVTLASQLSDQSSLFKSPSALRPWTTGAIVNDHHKAAVCHYIKTLSLFRSRVKEGTSMLSPRSVFIMSMLLITFEMLQGDMMTADRLITSSINLLKDTLELYRHDAQFNHSTQFSPRAKEDDMEDIEHLLPLISIMSGSTPFLISQTANIQLWETSRSYDLPEVGQSSITKLQTQWSKFHTRTVAFIGRAVAMQIQATTSPQATEGQQRVLIGQLNVWDAELDSWLANNRLYDELAQRTLQIMQIQHLMLLICVSSCLDTTELAFDACEADFSKLLTRCAIFLHEARPTYRFTLNTSILSALDVIVVKCRMHSIRMMAATLLRQLSWREGAWDSVLMMYGELGGVLLEESARDTGEFIAPEHRWFWTSGEWDIKRGVLVAKYTRAVPTEESIPVHTTQVLDLEKYPDVCFKIGCFIDHAAECQRLHLRGSRY